MAQLDPQVVAVLRGAKSNERVRLLVTCEGSCDPVITQLKSAGVEIANTIADISVIVLEARKQDLQSLLGLTGVAAIEVEGEEWALE